MTQTIVKSRRGSFSLALSLSLCKSLCVNRSYAGVGVQKRIKKCLLLAALLVSAVCRVRTWPREKVQDFARTQGFFRAKKEKSSDSILSFLFSFFLFLILSSFLFILSSCSLLVLGFDCSRRDNEMRQEGRGGPTGNRSNGPCVGPESRSRARLIALATITSIPSQPNPPPPPPN
jgi:hypothetical protein